MSRAALSPDASETERWGEVAAALGLARLDVVAPDLADPDDEPPAPEVFTRAESMLLGPAPDHLLVTAPSAAQQVLIGDFVARHPRERDRLVIAAPREIRRALIERWSAALTRRARRAVLDRDPDLSCVGTPEPWQLLVVAALIVVWFVASFGLFTPLIAFWTTLFLLIGVFRLIIADRGPDPDEPPPVRDADLPTVAVLVPLYREVEVLPDLVAALRRLDYPTDRLIVRLVVEADDEATRASAVRLVRDTPFDVVVVPPSLPRTKPKALDFALQTVAADFVTVYDAEDRPDPDQLRRVAAVFRAGPPELAVVQAALEIDHADGDRPWLVRQFEIEYAVLFHGLLPWLADRGLFLPLGGTSNHFRRATLDRVGAWDPANVTEDADIAVRLARGGFRFAMVASSTLEEAPKHWRAWSAQRTRWLKGWMQTWFTHVRTPLRLHRELGPADALAFHLVLGGQLVSAFAFAPSFLLLTLQALGLVPLFGDRFLDGDVVLLAGIFAYVTGIVGAWILALQVTARGRRRVAIADVLTMPLYWCAISFAAWRAVWELLAAPSQWNKTAHGLATRVAPARSTPCTPPPAEAMSESPERV